MLSLFGGINIPSPLWPNPPNFAFYKQDTCIFECWFVLFWTRFPPDQMTFMNYCLNKGDIQEEGCLKVHSPPQ